MQKGPFNRGWLAARLLEPHYQRILLGVMLVILLVAGLQPFNFYPKNRFSWIRGSRGVLFHGYAEIVGSSPLSSGGKSDSNDAAPGISVELWMSSFNEDPYVKDLLSVYVSGTREPFAVEEWDKKLIVAGIVRDTNGRRNFQRIRVEGAFATAGRRFITLTSGPEGTRIYLDGVLQSDSPHLTLERENFDGSLLLGQTASARQDWRGAIFGLAFYPQQLAPEDVARNFAAWSRGDLEEVRKTAELAIYPFDEREGTVVHNRGNLGADLSIPGRLRAVDPIILEVPSRSDLTNVSDIAINILGFIPFGGLLAIYLVNSRGWTSGKALLTTVSTGLLISLAIELLQVLLPTRDSSLLDFINNTLGTCLGAGLAIALLPGLRKMARQG